MKRVSWLKLWLDVTIRARALALSGAARSAKERSHALPGPVWHYLACGDLGTLAWGAEPTVAGVPNRLWRVLDHEAPQESPAVVVYDDVAAEHALLGVGAATGGNPSSDLRNRLGEERHVTAASSIDPEEFLQEHLAQASPDLMRELLGTFIGALLGVLADTVRGADYGSRSSERTN